MQNGKKMVDAINVRLEKSEGTVTVTASGGKAVSITDRMKLSNGYAVTTGQKSKAYLSVDESRVITLEENAALSVVSSSNGKKLEVYVTQGEAKMGAAGSLSKDESGNITVSTMVTGIRG